MIITAEEVRAGDIVDHDGARHLVTEVRRPPGGAWPVACDGAGWAIALGGQPLRVDREATIPDDGSTVRESPLSRRSR